MKTIIKVAINMILIAMLTVLFSISIASFLFWLIYLPLAVYQAMIVDKIFANKQKKMLNNLAIKR